MNERVRHIIRNLSSDKPKPPSEMKDDDDLDDDLSEPWGSAGIYAIARRIGYILRKRWVILCSCVLTIVSVYYYNSLYKLEWNARTEESSVEVYMQRRRDFGVNLENLTTTYIRHESDVFKYVAEIKTAMLGMSPELKKDMLAKSDKKTSQLLGQFFGLAEQYPHLQFSSEFQYAVTALMETERELAAARVRYNNSVNMYTSALGTVPGNFFALVFRYKPIPLFVPDKGGVEFRQLFDPKQARQL